MRFANVDVEGEPLLKFTVCRQGDADGAGAKGRTAAEDSASNCTGNLGVAVAAALDGATDAVGFGADELEAHALALATAATGGGGGIRAVNCCVACVCAAAAATAAAVSGSKMAERSGTECDRVGPPEALVGDSSRLMSGLSGDRFGGDACVTRRAAELSGDFWRAAAAVEADAAVEAEAEAEVAVGVEDSTCSTFFTICTGKLEGNRAADRLAPAASAELAGRAFAEPLGMNWQEAKSCSVVSS